MADILNRRVFDPHSVTIASGQTESGVVSNVGSSALGVIFPTMTGTTITFKVSDSNVGTFVVLNDEAGSPVQVTVVDDQAVTLPAVLFPWAWFKIVSSAAEGALRTIKIVRKG